MSSICHVLLAVSMLWIAATSEPCWSSECYFDVGRIRHSLVILLFFKHFWFVLSHYGGMDYHPIKSMKTPKITKKKKKKKKRNRYYYVCIDPPNTPPIIHQHEWITTNLSVCLRVFSSTFFAVIYTPTNLRTSGWFFWCLFIALPCN